MDDKVIENLRETALGGFGALVPIALSDAYLKNIALPSLEIKPSERKHFDKLLEKIRKTGVKVDLNKLYGPSFIPWSNKIVLNSEAVAPGVLAHEWGHALNYASLRNLGGGALAKLWNLAYGLGKVSGLGTTAAGLTAQGLGATDDTLLNIGAAGAAIQAPMLAEEILASARGAAKLKKLNMPGKLKAFMGVPTYMASTALPMTPWLVRKINKLANGIETE